MTDYGRKAQLLYQKHFPKFGPTILKKCTYVFEGDSSYSTSNSEATDNENDQQSLTIAFVDYEAKYIDDHKILRIDKMALFPALNITAAFKPLIDDKIIELSDNSEWIVKSVLIDPAGAGYELQVRPRAKV